ncbi:hypothetical protein CR513_00935, partial [Mucuna pruriens]
MVLQENVFPLGERSRVKSIPILYTIVDAPASYNIISAKQAGGNCIISKLMYEVSSWKEDSFKVGSHLPATTVNALELDLDLRCRYEHERPYPAEEL